MNNILKNYRTTRKKGTDEIFEIIMSENFPKINTRHQMTDPGRKQKKLPTTPFPKKTKNTNTKPNDFNLQKIKKMKKKS